MGSGCIAHLEKAHGLKVYGLKIVAGIGALLVGLYAQTAGAGQAGAAERIDAAAVRQLISVLETADDKDAWQAFQSLIAALPGAQRAPLLAELCVRPEGADRRPQAMIRLCAPERQAGAAGTVSARAATSADEGPRPSSSVDAVIAEKEDGEAKALEAAVDLGASLSSGDTDERAFSARIKAQQELARRWRHEIAVEADWARRSAETTQKRLVGDHRLFYELGARTTVFQFLRGEYDAFGGFDYRITESIGLGYEAIKAGRIGWRLEGGPGIRFIALADSTAMRQEPIARLSSEFRFEITPGWRLENDSSAFLGGEGNTLENTVALEARINSSLFGRISFNLRYDTKDLAGASKLDTLTKFSLGYRF